ncbi:hypothetical protein KBAHV46_33690 [Aeromonas hydrophila]|nr:hypothetical protein KBAHV27_33630 [Aeromonas hydrophila]CAD7549379.1 hypothetical protein KBAHV46_33690 [Aeromonas hydrophila]CAD7549413.1 hypothetical protein KBAHV42_33740 [Aeromonas hydrophila]CAD7550691.1 hypothetical protein KBAHV01_33620 [Aeromonas hydrophila]CAD7551103.1 hypothetical protein KBAHV22_33780 [Aeromonas hydrophila]
MAAVGKAESMASYLSSHFANGLSFAKSEYAKQLTESMEKVKIEIPFVAEGEFKGVLSRNNFTLSSADDFRQFLTVNDIKNSNEITESFLKGIETDPSCQGLRAECVISTRTFAIVIDYYNKKIRLFIGADWIGREEKEDEYLHIDGDNVVTNKMSLFFNSNNTGDSFTLNNKGYSGFSDGFFYHDITTNESGSELNDASYTWLQENKKIQVGRVKFGQYFNYAYGKSHLANSLFQGVIAGTSEQLNLNSSSGKLTFFSPIPGIVTVIKSKQEVLRKYVSAGIGNIDYSELPRGVYQADVTITSDDGAFISSIPSFIINDGSNFLSGIEVYTMYGASGEHLLPTYGAGISLPFSKNIVFSSSWQTIDSEQFIQLGSGYRNDSLDIFMGLTDSRISRDYELTMLWGGLSGNLTASKIKPINNGSVSQQLINTRSLRLSYNHPIGDASVLNYSYEYFTSINGNESNYGVNFSTPILNNIYLSSNYNRRGGDNIFGVNISIPIGSHSTISALANHSNNMLSSRVSGQYIGDYDDNTSYSLGVTTGDNDNNINAGVSYNGAGAKIASRVLASNQQGNAYGMQVDTNQILSRNGVEFLNPSRNGSYDSYIYLDENLSNDVNVNIKRMGSERSEFIDGNNVVSGVDAYKRYTVNAKVISGDYIFDNASDNYRKTIDLIPGKSLHIRSSRRPVIENILIIDKPRKGLRCHGDACISISNIQDNLYRLKTLSVGEVDLVSQEGFCHRLNQHDRDIESGNLMRVNCEI